MVAAMVLSMGTQTGCDSRVATRMIVVPGAGSAATNPEAAGCAEACLQRRRSDPRGATACLDTCPGAWTAWFDSCQDAPAGSGCYVLVTETLTPSPEKIAEGFRIAAEVADAVSDDEEDASDDGDRPEHEVVASRASGDSSKKRHAAKPKKSVKKRKVKPKDKRGHGLDRKRLHPK